VADPACAAALALSALLEMELSSDSTPSKSSMSRLTTPVDLRLGFFLR